MVRTGSRNGCRAAPETTKKASPCDTIAATQKGRVRLIASGPVTRRWKVIASGLLLLALAVVVIYTRPNAFLSPIALVVVAAIGLAALLLQVRFRRDLPQVRSPLWLNVLGLLCAMLALAADFLRMSRRTLEAVSFAAVVCFGVSGSLILRALRRPPKSAE
jgi:uncharacterized membrane protein